VTVAGGGIRRIDERIVEVKRMWTNPDYRRQGVATEMFDKAKERFPNIEEASGRWQLGATIAGEMFNPARHPSRVLVKSATYHGLSVSQSAHGYTARIVFDI